MLHSVCYTEVPVFNSVQNDQPRLLVCYLKQNQTSMLFTPQPKDLGLREAVLGRSSGQEKDLFRRIFKVLEPNVSEKPKLKKKPRSDTEEIFYKLEGSSNLLSYKFGVLCVSPGQTTEGEILGAREESAEFLYFLNLLGERVRLKGFKEYRGGLDTKLDMSGTHSYYTQWIVNEVENHIMFHVATMLPFSPNDLQQIERKRHIGNDVVIILFLEGETTRYSPDTIPSNQTHLIIGVRPLGSVQGDSGRLKRQYQIEIASKYNVPAIDPAFPVGFTVDEENLKDVVLTKACAGERGIMKCGVFQERLLNFKMSRLKSMYMT